jgi:hypothetical protein
MVQLLVSVAAVQAVAQLGVVFLLLFSPQILQLVPMETLGGWRYLVVEALLDVFPALGVVVQDRLVTAIQSGVLLHHQAEAKVEMDLYHS